MVTDNTSVVSSFLSINILEKTKEKMPIVFHVSYYLRDTDTLNMSDSIRIKILPNLSWTHYIVQMWKQRI